MSFSKKTKEDAFNSADGHCERCGKKLSFGNNGREGWGKWEAHHKNSNGGDILSNCEILCFDCHVKTRNFGR